jgi:hypothetical protein
MVKWQNNNQPAAMVAEAFAVADICLVMGPK